MGKDCSVFSAIKFRSMVPVKEITRKYDENRSKRFNQESYSNSDQQNKK